MINVASPFASALNHLLEAEPWARERLAPFAGETLEMRAPPLPPLRFTITADGALGAALPVAESSLVVTIPPSVLAAAVKGEDHLLRSIDVAGNAKLAGEIMFLARHLRWDVEEEVAKFVGDALAHRLVGLARQATAWHADMARRIAGSIVEYAVEEKHMLVKRAALEQIAAVHAHLRDGLERLDKRIERLAGER
jgi:ubiquinone biosynthesis accessory factor UbiJ